MDHTCKTVSEALNISDSWRLENLKKMFSEMETLDTVSEVLENSMHRLRDEEFGEIENSITVSMYEKKLMYTGFMIGIQFMNYHKQVNSKICKK